MLVPGICELKWPTMAERKAETISSRLTSSGISTAWGLRFLSGNIGYLPRVLKWKLPYHDCQRVTESAGMCSRYNLTSPPEAVRAYFGYADTPNFPARYNIAPTQAIPVVLLDEAGARRFALMRWGLLPAFVKDPKLS